MDKRFLLALVLTALVIVVTPLLFPDSYNKRPAPSLVDSSTIARRPPTPDSVRLPASSGSKEQVLPTTAVAQSPALRVDTTVVHTGRATYAFSSRGAVPISVVLDSYPSRRPSAGTHRVELVRPHDVLARYRLVVGADTIALNAVDLTKQNDGTRGSSTDRLSYVGAANGHSIRVDYGIVPDSFLVRLRTTVGSAPAGSALLVDLPKTLSSNEPDTLDDIGHLAVSFRSSRTGDVTSVPFTKLDSTETRSESGPLSWVATRNKYFLVAYRTEAKSPFSQLRLRGGSRNGKIANEVLATATLPLGPDGSATVDLYTGPQDFVRLQRLGSDLDQVNPYAGWLHGVVQPFATIVMRALLWMKHTTALNYGWVLVLFGIFIRLALWPLNQGAMRTSMKMQRLQPELQAIQKKYSDDPKRQQEAIMKVYKDHGMSPISPLMGCLPMLLPMPILFALYFVFQNTIEFRGVSFLWLPDISLRDPYYITPLFMGVSMFVMSWIGMKGSPPNPQAKMMSYMMPVMLTVLFLNFASGLNLYYAVQNIAALPQQWFLARERSRNPQIAVVPSQAPRAAVKRRT